MAASSLSKPKSDPPPRFAAAMVMIAVASLLIWMGGWPFRMLVFTGAAIMMIEWGDMNRVRRIWSWAAILFIAVTLWLAAGFLDGRDMPLIASPLPGYAPVLAFGLFTVLTGLLSRRFSMAWGYVYIAVPACALIFLGVVSSALVFWVMAVTWATDIFAYFAGRTIGGPKLAPRISPNKTWAGLAGGMAGAALLGWILASFFGLGAPYLWLGALMAVIAQAGDLYESLVKRRAGVKDSGVIIPGHGGVLDRVDGLLAVSAATALVVITNGLPR